MIDTLYQNAELAIAAYATLSQGPTSDQLQNLRAQGFSEKQSTEFARRYPTVVTQYTATSFSATVFKDTAGNLTLAIRGTLEGGDFIPTDVDIAGYGAGYDQIAAMYNWWKRAASPAGQSVDQYEVRFVPLFDEPPTGALSLYMGTSGASIGTYYLVSAASAVATGELVSEIASDADQRLAVTGHSLGGHLAMAFGALFPGAAGQITAFNAPGFLTTPTNEAFFATLGGTLPAGLNTINVIADEAGIGEVPWSAIAGLHNRPGVAVDIAIENQWLSDEPDPPAALNHSQQTLTDALAVYATLAGLDPTLMSGAFKSILDGAVLGTAAGLERVVDALERLFVSDTALLATGNTQREALYQAIYAIQGSATYQAAVQSAAFAQVVSLGTLSGDEIAQRAATDIAYRYALVNLTPFALVTADAALYAPHVASGELAPETFTAEYLADRAYMLDRLLLRNRIDGTVSGEVREEFRDVETGVLFHIDAANASPARQYVFGGMIGDTITGLAADDRLYGGGGVDVVTGGAGNDYLEGGADNDTLQGGAGNDRLIGGAGSDTYVYDNGDGHDTIVDDGGQGSVVFNGATLIGGSQIVEGIWRSADEAFTYAFDGDLQAGGVLVVNGVLRIENFTNGALGIVLGEAEAPTPREQLLTGTDASELFALRDLGLDRIMFDTYVDVDGVDFVYKYTDIYYPGYAGNDFILTEYGSDLVEAGPGSDLVSSRDGDDEISGGEGNDAIFSGPGSDRVEGGLGDDLIVSGEEHYFEDYWNSDWHAWRDVVSGFGIEVSADPYLGNDGEAMWDYALTLPQTAVAGMPSSLGAGTVFSYTPNSLYGGSITYENPQWNEPSIYTIYYELHEKFDAAPNWFSGGEGDDTLVGDIGSDVLLGGIGNDKIAGRAGSDTLLGGSGEDGLLGGADADEIDGGSANDYIFGGSGDDRIFGGLGNDTVSGDNGDANIGDADEIYGGVGEDRLSGNGGDDRVYGGDDSDVLWGHDGNDTLLGENGIDWLFGGADNDLLIGGEGTDTLLGETGNDRLEGGLGNDVLDGGTGADILDGGAGTDTLYADDNDVVLVRAGGGDDYIVWSGQNGRLVLEGISDTDLSVSQVDNPDGSQSFGLSFGSRSVFIANGFLGAGRTFSVQGADLDQRTIMAHASAVNLTGTEGADTIYGSHQADTLRGFAPLAAVDADDQLFGQGGADHIEGGLGNDRLDGGTGADVLVGGLGDDIYVVDEVGDVAIENAGEGADTVETTIDYTAPGNIDNVALLGTATIDAAGNAADNRLFGNTAANTLGGLDGNDVLLGRSGNDALDGGAGADQLYGEDGNDRLDGGMQDDALYGGAGDDVFVAVLGSGTDVVVDIEGANVVEFGAGIARESLDITQYQGDDGAYYLRIGYGPNGDVIAVKNGLSGVIQSYRFADGTSVSHADLVGQATVPVLIEGTRRNDVIHGSNRVDRI